MPRACNLQNINQIYRLKPHMHPTNRKQKCTNRQRIEPNIYYLNHLNIPVHESSTIFFYFTDVINNWHTIPANHNTNSKN